MYWIDWIKSAVSYVKIVNTHSSQPEIVFMPPTWGKNEDKDPASKQKNYERCHKLAQAIIQERDEKFKNRGILLPPIPDDGVYAPLPHEVDPKMLVNWERKEYKDLELKRKVGESIDNMLQAVIQESSEKLKKPKGYGLIRIDCRQSDFGSLCAQETHDEAKEEYMKSVHSVKPARSQNDCGSLCAQETHKEAKEENLKFLHSVKGASTQYRKEIRLIIEEHKGAILASFGEFNSFPNDKETQEVMFCSSCQQKLVECLGDADGSDLSL